LIENKGQESPLIFIHDYHLALLPEILRKHIPKAIIIYFWHIPWPSLKQLKKCPWQSQIVSSLAYSNNIGFQTKTDVNRFDQALEKHHIKNCDPIFHPFHVGDYPATIEWPTEIINSSEHFDEISNLHQLDTKVILGLGVDRFDYIKGIIERLTSIETLFNTNPNLKGKLVFLQILISTRKDIEEFFSYEKVVKEKITDINNKFLFDDWRPLVLITNELDKKELTKYYKASDFLMISSLKDGMNLVAKEFVASRDDEMGILLLSKFTGSSQKLKEAIIFNPKDEISTVNAINAAIAMPALEIKNRMVSLRKYVRKNDIYLWVKKQVEDAGEKINVNEFQNPD
jgi:trehalose 6-phosphate synthase